MKKKKKEKVEDSKGEANNGGCPYELEKNGKGALESASPERHKERHKMSPDKTQETWLDSMTAGQEALWGVVLVRGNNLVLYCLIKFACQIINCA